LETPGWFRRCHAGSNPAGTAAESTLLARSYLPFGTNYTPLFGFKKLSGIDFQKANVRPTIAWETTIGLTR